MFAGRLPHVCCFCPRGLPGQKIHSEYKLLKGYAAPPAAPPGGPASPPGPPKAKLLQKHMLKTNDLNVKTHKTIKKCVLLY